MGLNLKQLQDSLGIVKDYSDQELSEAERRIEILLESLYEVIRNERQDPLKVLDDNTGIEDTPVGHILTFMGTTAPRHYLPCDGRVLNIADYKFLSQHMIKQFGKANYFGGNGTSTFALPDLRGEFLRGTGTASRNTGTGASVGVHQDATQIPNVGFEGGTNGRLFAVNTSASSSNAIVAKNMDKNINTVTSGAMGNTMAPVNSWTNDNMASIYGTDTQVYTPRPTNTAVLYCIKYEPTYYIRTGPDAYSYKKEETRVGTWHDGKPLYRQILEVQGPFGTKKTATLNIGPASTSKIVKMSTTLRGIQNGINWGANITYVNTSAKDVIDVWFNQDTNLITIDTMGPYTVASGVIIIEILYTKTAYYAVLGIDRKSPTGVSSFLSAA